ncbi:MAG TPA: SDR family oxidoreductase [Steroidobacteraceae bacterium]|jgi:NAD(P)-dependent dehydrogenase (short-subunit alcohol dehydrogenase family)|nr:SDR family oxidoreductase [Steroidobacteraceae bacterium]
MSGLLADKTAVIYGGGGAIGGAAARVFAREGARVFLAGRTEAKLATVARDIAAAGGAVEIAVLDVFDERAVGAHADAVAAKTGRLDVMLNAIGIAHVQGKQFAETPLAEFVQPITDTARAQFIPAQAVARHMIARKCGVILTLTTPGGRIAGKGFLANGVFSAATEAFSRLLAAEIGGNNIRVVCLRPDVILDAVELSGAREVFEGVAKRVGIPMLEMIAERGRKATLLGRGPRLAEVAEFAAFAASDRAGAMTAAIANLTCGSLVD